MAWQIARNPPGGYGPMSDDAPENDLVLETLNALEDTFLEGAPPEIRWLAASTRLLPRHAEAIQQTHDDPFQQHIDLAVENAQIERVEEALVENWIHSAECSQHDAEPDGPPSPRGDP